jgi:DNA primase small subunit
MENRTDAAKLYYASSLPLELVYRLLISGNREVCFQSHKDAWTRRLFFGSSKGFKSRLLRDAPVAVHIGAVYSEPTKSSLPVSKELVFDIDLQDYDDVRKCCKESKTCEKCWTFCQVAMKILDRVLREGFGFENIAFFFSGNKGFHCWVFDEDATLSTAEERRYFADFFLPLNRKKLELANPLIEEIYEDYVKDAAEVITGVPASHLMGKMEEIAIVERAFMYAWPRLDSGVTRQVGHALKMPFCIHPVSRKRCIMIDPQDCPYPTDTDEEFEKSVQMFSEFVDVISPKNDMKS